MSLKTYLICPKRVTTSHASIVYMTSKKQMDVTNGIHHVNGCFDFWKYTEEYRKRLLFDIKIENHPQIMKTGVRSCLNQSKSKENKKNSLFTIFTYLQDINNMYLSTCTGPLSNVIMHKKSCLWRKLGCFLSNGYFRDFRDFKSLVQIQIFSGVVTDKHTNR